MAGSKRRRKQVDATPRKEGRVSARLQSLYSPADQPQTPVVDFVRAGMPFKARKWVKAVKSFGGEGPQGFSVPRWAPSGPPTPELQAIKMNPAPRHKGRKKSPRSSPTPGSASESNNDDSQDEDAAAAHAAARDAMESPRPDAAGAPPAADASPPATDGPAMDESA